MVTVPPGAYPLRGVAYLCSHPRLNAKVGGFLAGVSALCIAAIFTLALLTFHSQLHLFGHSLIGTGTVGKILTCLLILVEASLAVYLIFKQTMQILQRRLFMDVLQGARPTFSVQQMYDKLSNNIGSNTQKAELSCTCHLKCICTYV